MIGINRLCTIHYRSLPKRNKMQQFHAFFRRHFSPPFHTLQAWHIVADLNQGDLPTCFCWNYMGGNPKNRGKNPKMDGENNGKPCFSWMIWGYPYFRKHPYTSSDSTSVSKNRIKESWLTVKFLGEICAKQNSNDRVRVVCLGQNEICITGRVLVILNLLQATGRSNKCI